MWRPLTRRKLICEGTGGVFIKPGGCQQYREHHRGPCDKEEAVLVSLLSASIRGESSKAGVDAHLNCLLLGPGVEPRVEGGPGSLTIHCRVVLLGAADR